MHLSTNHALRSTLESSAVVAPHTVAALRYPGTSTEVRSISANTGFPRASEAGSLARLPQQFDSFGSGRAQTNPVPVLRSVTPLLITVLMTSSTTAVSTLLMPMRIDLSLALGLSAVLSAQSLLDARWRAISETAEFAVTALDGTNRAHAITVLNALRAAFADASPPTEETSRLEPTWSDDGALLLEWQIGSRRLGVSLEPDPRDSGWFLVSVDPNCPAHMHGPIESFDAAASLKHLLKS